MTGFFRSTAQTARNIPIYEKQLANRRTQPVKQAQLFIPRAWHGQCT